MRWNVVIGGQLLSKSLRGFIDFIPPVFGINGIITSAIMLILPFIVLAAIIYLIPPWQDEVKRQERRMGLQGTSLVREQN
jgi:predicted membrane protein